MAHRMRRLGWSVACTLTLSAITMSVTAQSPSAQTRPIATIDFYGQRTLDAEALRKALPIHVGDLISRGDGARLTPSIRAALAGRPHLRDSRLEFFCCAEGGGVHAFVGVQEDGTPEVHFRTAPTGAIRLPAQLVAHSHAWDRALMEAVSKGHSAEDDSQGHALLTQAPEARTLQEQNVALAARNLETLRRVLRESADAEQRAMAARYLGYAPDKQAVVSDLVRAMTDSDSEVRNDSMRALLVFSRSKVPPPIPYDAFVGLLDTPTWTDLNKSSNALMALSSTRDPQLLDMLRKRSMPALMAMAHWRDRDHSPPAYWLLGRIAGLSDQEIQDRWDRADADGVIAAALKRRAD
jgi:hypothetical protein